MNKNGNVEQGRCEPCFWWRNSDPVCGQRATHAASVGQQMNPSPRGCLWFQHCHMRQTLQPIQCCCSPQTIFCCSLRCFFPLKLTEKWAVPQHIFQVRYRFRMFSLKTANDCFQLGLTKASFLCCFFILHETVQIKCSMKEWNDLIYCWWCSLTTSNF